MAATLALLVAGCGGASDDPLPGGDDASGGTTMAVYSVSEARAVDEDGSLTVTGSAAA